MAPTITPGLLWTAGALLFVAGYDGTVHALVTGPVCAPLPEARVRAAAASRGCQGQGP